MIKNKICLSVLVSISVATTTISMSNQSNANSLVLTGSPQQPPQTISLPPATKAAINDVENFKLVVSQQELASNESNEERCADPNQEGSLAEEQARVIKERQELNMKNIDLRSVFDVAKKGGCFAALSEFPDLSITIPSLTAIFDSLKNTLLKYAMRKVCNAVDDVLDETVTPIKDAMEKISDSGQLDMTGRVNKKMYEELYEVDKELGRVSSPVKGDYEKEIEFVW